MNSVYRFINILGAIIAINAIAALPALAGGFETGPVVYLDQNWGPKVRQSFYTTPQGSHLIPLNFALALRDPQTGQRFFTSEFLQRFGFIPQKPDPVRNPLGLPIGLTIDGYTSVGFPGEFGSINRGPRVVGMTCAACHTNNLTYNGTTVRIDGGQSLLNFQAFTDSMDRAVFATADDKTKLAKFLNRAQKESFGRPSKTRLLQDFQKFVNERAEWRRMNGSTTQYGYGRTDAFGVIFNQVLARSLRIPANAQEPNAPVSYPVLWDTPHHDFVQWTGLVSNSAANSGPLSRNVGQVLGVFGQIDLFKQTEILKGYCNSARRRNLVALEQWTQDLTSPQWPEAIFGHIDSAKANRGRSLYNQQCLSCHAVLSDTRSPDRTVTARLIPVPVLGVDPKLSINSARMVQSGQLTGYKTKLILGRTLEATEPATILLSHVVAGAIAGSISANSCHDKIDADPAMLVQAWTDFFKRLQDPPAEDPLDKLPTELRNSLIRQGLARIKARPLNGIWASAPFLHNGSVKNFYELLLPATERSAQFVLGCTNFDIAKLGYECGSPEAVTTVGGLSVLDTTVSGSRNTGHEYGVGLSEADRYDLLEYLKTL